MVTSDEILKIGAFHSSTGRHTNDFCQNRRGSSFLFWKREDLWNDEFRFVVKQLFWWATWNILRFLHKKCNNFGLQKYCFWIYFSTLRFQNKFFLQKRKTSPHDKVPLPHMLFQTFRTKLKIERCNSAQKFIGKLFLYQQTKKTVLI